MGTPVAAPLARSVLGDPASPYGRRSDPPPPRPDCTDRPAEHKAFGAAERGGVMSLDFTLQADGGRGSRRRANAGLLLEPSVSDAGAGGELGKGPDGVAVGGGRPHRGKLERRESGERNEGQSRLRDRVRGEAGDRDEGQTDIEDDPDHLLQVAAGRS